MHPFKIEHSKGAYRADFLLYAAAAMLLLGVVAIAGPPVRRANLAAWSGIGLFAWSFIEYLLHRFVLHGLAPFEAWHAEHHRRPAALISAPTLLSAALIAGLVFLPAWAWGDLWLAAALTSGFVTGYLLYALMHHGIHHLRARGTWMRERQRRHGLHHNGRSRPGHYGVTSDFWDHVFGTDRLSARGRCVDGHGSFERIDSARMGLDDFRQSLSMGRETAVRATAGGGFRQRR